MHPKYPDGAEVQGMFGGTLTGQPKRWVWFRGTVKYRLATPGNHGGLQLKISWQALPERGEKAEPSNLEMWDDRPLPECPLKLRTPENQVASGILWTRDVRAAWREEPNIPQEERVAAALGHKLCLGQ